VSTTGGRPRTTRIGKADFEGSRNLTWFADRQQIQPLARLALRGIEDPRSLASISRQSLATSVANLRSAVNEIHAFREGDGRAQRLLFTAIAEAARHPVAFDVITRERMVATSIAAAAGNTSGFARMFEEITDPPRVEALRRGLHAKRRFGIAGRTATRVRASWMRMALSGSTTSHRASARLAFPTVTPAT
jgi:cell filamentation protein